MRDSEKKTFQEKVRNQTDEIRKALVLINIIAQPSEEEETDPDERYDRAYEIYSVLEDQIEFLLDIFAEGTTEREGLLG